MGLTSVCVCVGVSAGLVSSHQEAELLLRYEKIYEEVQRLEPVQLFLGWMKVDGRGLKSALLNVIKKWSFMFKQHLVDHVTHRCRHSLIL